MNLIWQVGKLRHRILFQLNTNEIKNTEQKRIPVQPVIHHITQLSFP